MLKCLSLNSQQKTSADKDVEKRQALCIFVGMRTGAATVENSIKSPQKIKNGSALDPAIPLLGIFPKNTKTPIQSNLCTPMFIAALTTIVKC